MVKPQGIHKQQQQQKKTKQIHKPKQLAIIRCH